MQIFGNDIITTASWLLSHNISIKGRMTNIMHEAKMTLGVRSTRLTQEMIDDKERLYLWNRKGHQDHDSKIYMIATNDEMEHEEKRRIQDTYRTPNGKKRASYVKVLLPHPLQKDPFGK
jgi:hypothetical protein